MVTVKMALNTSGRLFATVLPHCYPAAAGLDTNRTGYNASVQWNYEILDELWRDDIISVFYSG